MKIRTLMLVAAVALFAVPAFAQRYEMMQEVQEVDTMDGWSGGGSYDLTTYMDNPCTAWQDYVAVDYNVYLYQEGWDAAGSADRYLFDENTYMGGAYTATGASQSDVAYKAVPFTLRKYHKVNTGDQFHVVTVINFDPATRESTVTIETACGNGMPDSAQ